jgi:serine-type D-Ala-D-Ala endopeptidase (penicillin-binding protein 7)
VTRWDRFKAVKACAVAFGIALAALAAQPSVAGKVVNKPSAKAAPAKKPAGNAVRKTRSAAKANVGPRKSKAVRVQARRVAAPAVLSVGQLAGLHAAEDPLDLKSSVAFVIDQDTNQVLLSKNSDAVLPIASITKLMTALVVVEAGLSMDETVSIGQEDVELTANNRSRLLPGTAMSRGEMLRLALMSSENRAASALSRHYPGGAPAFIAAMNRKAAELGMHDTRYVEPTGLSSDNRASARDLSVLVKAAADHQIIRELSTATEAQVAVGPRHVQFHNTNRLVTDPTWDIGLQKTGYIAAAGRCLVMQAQLAGRRLTMVLLDSAGKYSRLGDAERIRQWLSQSAAVAAQSTVSVPTQTTIR